MIRQKVRINRLCHGSRDWVLSLQYLLLILVTLRGAQKGCEPHNKSCIMIPFIHQHQSSRSVRGPGSIPSIPLNTMERYFRSGGSNRVGQIRATGASVVYYSSCLSRAPAPAHHDQSSICTYNSGRTEVMPTPKQKLSGHWCSVRPHFLLADSDKIK